MGIIAGRERSGPHVATAPPPPGLGTVDPWPPEPRPLAVDAGTTGVRTLVVDPRGDVVDIAYRKLTQYFPRPGLGRARS